MVVYFPEMFFFKAGDILTSSVLSSETEAGPPLVSFKVSYRRFIREKWINTFQLRPTWPLVNIFCSLLHYH